MLRQIALLMAFQFVGELLVKLIGVPFPGPLCGMGLLLAYLHLSGDANEDLRTVAATLTDHLGLLFVPAGAAIVAYAALLAAQGLVLLAAVVVSTAGAILVVGLIVHGGSRRLARLTDRETRPALQRAAARASEAPGH